MNIITGTYSGLGLMHLSDSHQLAIAISIALHMGISGHDLDILPFLSAEQREFRDHSGSINNGWNDDNLFKRAMRSHDAVVSSMAPGILSAAQQLLIKCLQYEILYGKVCKLCLLSARC